MDRKIAVVGLGYVGLPVAVTFGRVHQVIGFDINENRIKKLKENYDRTNEVTTEGLKILISNLRQIQMILKKQILLLLQYLHLLIKIINRT